MPPRKPHAALAAIVAALLAIACLAPVRADFEQGLQAAKRRDFAQAYAHLLPAAQAGHAQAQLYVANMYRRGYGVERSYAQAARWYRAAAEQGEPSGMYNYAVHLREGLGVARDEDAATAWFEKGARAGHSASMLNLGLRYFNGLGAPLDKVLGYAWVHKAAGKGSVPAIHRRRGLVEELSAEEIKRGRALALTLLR
jgi:TPR repeat protein